MKQLSIERIPSPIGAILLVRDGASVCALDYAGCEERMLRLLNRRYGAVELVPGGEGEGYSERIAAYFAGELTALNGLPVETGGTDFQRQVWQALRTIPAGCVLTYGELARTIGRPTAARAVGMTNGLNPIALILPCHRLVAANASLAGYAGGLERKAWLLRHEGVSLRNRV